MNECSQISCNYADDRRSGNCRNKIYYNFKEEVKQREDNKNQITLCHKMEYCFRGIAENSASLEQFKFMVR